MNALCCGAKRRDACLSEIATGHKWRKKAYDAEREPRGRSEEGLVLVSLDDRV
jgi:hypothetical protein